MEYIFLNIIALLILMLLSAFFSGTETALFSLKKSDINSFSLSDNKRENYLYRIMKDPKKVLITILTGNLFVNIIFSAISTKLLLDLWGGTGHFISIALVTPFIIVLCEITPKVIAINTYMNFSKRAVLPLRMFHKLFYPLRLFLLVITDILARIFRLDTDKDKNITEEELDMAVRMGEVEGIIRKEESAYIQNVMRFAKKEAGNIMYPRNKAVFISYDSTIEDAVKIFLETGVVRAPVYKKDLDHVAGVIDSRELVPYMMGLKKAKKISTLVHNIHYYPASKELGDLLAEFLKKKIQIAIVVDEYGGTDGVVTLSSILSELMGKEYTQWEGDYKPDKIKVNDETYIIPGDMQIDDYNFNFNENIKTIESDTIGGYIIEVLGHFPKRLEKIETEKNVLLVRHIKKNRIEKIEVKNLRVPN